MSHAAASRPGRVTLIALAFAAGIALGNASWAPPPETWLTGSAIAGALAFASRRRAGITLAALAVAVALLGAAWLAVRRDAVAPTDLLARLGRDPVSIHAIGTALHAPVTRAPGAGSLGRFSYRGPYTEFPLAIETLVGRDGRSHPASGRLLVRVGETVAPFRAGDRIAVRGAARRGAPARNPGGFDHDRYLRSRGYAGVLAVSERALLSVTSEPRPAWSARLARLRAQWRRRAEANLFGERPRAGARDAVLDALLFGRRDPAGATVGAAFRRVGLAHLLAISGLHLGILVGLVLLVAGGRTGARPGHAVLVAVVVILYLLLIDVRLPVLRAAVMTTAAAFARAGRRRWPGASLVALSGVALLVWRPEQLFEPGFQLSFGVVLALVHYGAAVRRRWFGHHGLEGTGAGAAGRGTTTIARLIARWLGAALAAATVAWAIATPITVFHFGMISPGGVPLGVLALPVVTLVLALGYLRILLAGLMPSAGAALDLALLPLADGLVALVEHVDAWPGSVVFVPPPPAAWAIVASAWTVAWARGSVTGRRRRGVWIAAGVGLAAWLAAPLLPRARPDLRIDTLAVGDGTCHVLRSGASTALVDAGSGSSLDAGRTVIVPALRALGVRSIDWISISHANLDHFSAVPEIAAAYPGVTIIVAPQFLRAAARDPEGSAAFLLRLLARNGTPIAVAAAGATRTLGVARVRWLHPGSDVQSANENDNSVVLAIETAHHRVILTGDIEAEAITRLRDRHPGLTADVVELPHHGSFNPDAAALIDTLRPRLLLQSTGPRRLERDPWGPRLGRRRRIVTARDGAGRVVSAGRNLRFGGFGQGWVDLGRTGSAARAPLPATTIPP